MLRRHVEGSSLRVFGDRHKQASRSHFMTRPYSGAAEAHPDSLQELVDSDLLDLLNSPGNDDDDGNGGATTRTIISPSP